MSRVGKQPVALPEKVKVVVADGKVAVEGPLGRLELLLSPGIQCEVASEKKQILVRRSSDTKEQKMRHGLDRSLVKNMVIGVSQGYRKELEIVGVGYTAKLDGTTLLLDLGFANTVRFAAPKGIKVEVAQQTNPGRVVITGCDKHDVGQFAALVRAAKPPEPYQGKGIKYSDEVIRRKAGKAFGSSGG